MSSKKHRKPQPATTTDLVEVQSPVVPAADQLTTDQPTLTEVISPVAEMPTPPIVDAPVETPAAVPTPELAAATTPALPEHPEAQVPPAEEPTPASTDQAETAAPTEAVKEEPAKATSPKARRGKISNDLSALDAAAKVLGRTQQAMNCKEMIGVMAVKGWWTSPKGATPHSTLYAAILREIQLKGKASRFVKIGRGMFALNPKIEEAATTPKTGTSKKKAKAEKPKPAVTETTILDGTEGPESLKELFRI